MYFRLGLVVWGEGGVKERGRLCPDYFTPPPRQVRGLEEAVATRHFSLAT